MKQKFFTSLKSPAPKVSLKSSIRAKFLRGFTLLELLVVISIISLMSSMTLVLINNSRQKASEAKTLSFAAHVYHVLGSDAVGMWNFDADTANTVKDYSSEGNDCDWVPAGTGAYSDDKIVGAKSGNFNGHSLNCPDSSALRLTKNFTLEAWLKTNWETSGVTRIIQKRPSPTEGYALTWNFYSTDRKFTILLNGTSISGNKIVNQGSDWHHIVGTYDGRKVRIYIDGQLDKESDLSLTVESGTINMYISHTGNPWPGLMDEVKIYQSALTAFEVQQRFAQGAQKHGIAIDK